MDCSPFLDIYNIDAEASDRDPDKRICTGFLDTTLSIFEHHNHPFVLISTLAMRWSGNKNLPGQEIDVLVRSSQVEAIVDDLIKSKEWAISQDPNEVPSTANETAIQDIWLKALIDIPLDMDFQHLRLWPEELYRLSVTDCHKVEIPDVLAITEVCLEEEYYRDPLKRFGPPILGTILSTILPPLEDRAKLDRRDIPIYVPTIQDHINALLDQWRIEILTKLYCGNGPGRQLWNFVRYHFLERAPTRSWLLSSKIIQRNVGLMTYILDNYKRKPIVQLHRIPRKGVYKKGLREHRFQESI